MTKVGTKGLIYRLVKQTQFCVSFIAPWWRNESFQRTQCFQFLNGSLFRSSPVVMNLRWRLKEYCQKNKQQRWDICEEFSVWHFVTKSTGLECVKARMSSYFPNWQIPAMLVGPCIQNVPGKNEVLRDTVDTHGEAAQRSPKGHMAWLHLQPRLVPCRCGSQQKYLKFLLIVRYFGSS